MQILREKSTYAILLTLLICISGCAQKQQQSNEPVKLTVCGSAWYGHAPVWIGIDKEIFKKNGFDVTFTSVTSSTDRLAAVTTNSCQFAGLGEVAMLSFMAQGNTNFYWVGNQDIAPGFEGIVAQGKIKTLKDLKGKKVAIQFASSVDITVYDILSHADVDPFRDIKRVNMKANEMVIALTKGYVDAAAIWEPTFSELLKIQGAHVLARDTDTEIYKKYKTMTGPDVLVINKSFADENEAQAKKFLKIYFDAIAYIKEHPDETADIAVRYTHQDKKLLQNAFSKIVWRGYDEQMRILSDDGMFPQVEEVIEFLHGKAKAIPVKPDYRKWVKSALYEK